MLNKMYRLVEPGNIEKHFSSIDIQNDVIIKPTHLSICHADQRYYQGRRNPNILKQKLPMALIHESIGVVVKDNTNTFNTGDHVVMIPLIPGSSDELISENYVRDSKFRSSGYDGFMQELISIDKDRVIKLPDNTNLDVLAFSELISVAAHALSRFKHYSHQRRNKIGIWGDGNLSYILSLLLKIEFPESKIYVMGKHSEKLGMFSFVHQCILIDDIDDTFKIDHAFECTGGMGCESAINQIIKYINPQGSISLLGVSENKVPINTRDVLEKGLVLFGSSRSGRADFEKTLWYLEEYPQLVEYLENIVNNVIEIKTIADIKEAFNIDKNSSFGKTIMKCKY